MANMRNINETKTVITGVTEKLKKSILREESYKRELENDKATLIYIEKMIENGDTLPLGSAYSSLSEWAEEIKKQIKATEASIKRIGVEKDEIVAFEYFLENAQDETLTA